MLESLIVAQERMRVEMQTGFTGVRGELNELRGGLNGVRSGLSTLNSRVDNLEDQIASLRQTLTDYHGSVMGHGILITELDTRLTHVERHMDLPPRA